MSGRRRWLTALLLLIIIAAVAAPSLAYDESQFELQSGNLLVQDQFYRTSPRQTLFHSQTAAGTDTEAFAFSPLSGNGFTLAQTSAGSLAATECGFYTASFSFLKFSCPTAEGYMHTSIGDPIVSRTPVFSSLILPAMIKKDQIRKLAASPLVVGGGAGTDEPAINTSARQAATGMPTINGTGNTTLNNLTITEPLLKKQISSTRVGVPDTTNIMAVTPTPSPRPTPAPVGNLSAAARAVNATPSPSPTPLPLPESPETLVPKAEKLLTKPMSRQANKPFTEYPGPGL